MRHRPELVEPSLVAHATEMAARAGFMMSCTPQVGRLLAALAAIKPNGVIAESGTGYGVGTAWLRYGLAVGASLVTVDRDPQRTEAVANMFGDDPRVRVLTGDWRLLRDHAPFDVFFCDGGGKRDDPAGVVELLALGGVLVLDDFTPANTWPPTFEGGVDDLRLFYLAHPRLLAVELVVGPDKAVVVGTRR